VRAAPPDEVVSLAERRAEARAEKDYETADALRDRIADAGWSVVDEGTSWRLDPRTPTRPARFRASDVGSVLEDPPTADVSVQWVCEGWPDDIVRGLASFRAVQGPRDVQYVIADVSGIDPAAFGPDVEVVALEEGTGWGAARNAGLRRAAGRLVFVVDGSLEAAGDLFSPLEAALADPAEGIAGPFGIVTHDLRQFEAAPGPGPCDAVEGYLMAMRREIVADAGLFDEKFRWYRTADVELSFRVKDRGLRTDVVDVPVIRHEHRMWFETEPAERAKWSKRNFYRFLDRWRDRWDLVLDPRPPEG
jgi:hypothetical protein